MLSDKASYDKACVDFCLRIHCAECRHPLEVVKRTDESPWWEIRVKLCAKCLDNGIELERQRRQATDYPTSQEGP